MTRTLFLYFIVFVVGWCTKANALCLSDTISANKNSLSVLLQGNSHIKRVEYLNALYSPAHANLKSYSTGLQLDSVVTTAWSDESQTIRRSELFTCNFEDDGKNVLVDIFRWDAANNKWTIGDHNYYFFDENERLEQTEFQEYVSLEYRLITRIDYVYENDLLKFESRYDRIDEIETWSELEQFEYQYNDSNKLQTVSLNKWDRYENDWITEYYEKYTYDSIGNVAIKTGYDYNHFEMLSTKKNEWRYKYNEANELVESIEYIPGWVDETFVPESKQDNVYNNNSMLVSETFYKWSYDADGWIGEVKLEYSDVIEGAKVYESSSYLWNKKEMKWEGSQKLEFIVENNYLPSDIENWEFIETYMPAFSFDGVVCDDIISSRWENMQWLNSGGADYYFSDGTLVGVNEMDNYLINVYPNPVVDVLNIEIDNFEETMCIIRNLNGQIILQSNFQSRGKIQLSGVTSGVYFVELYAQDNLLQIGKIIKQ